jgi:hypothetical protein
LIVKTVIILSFIEKKSSLVGHRWLGEKLLSLTCGPLMS